MRPGGIRAADRLEARDCSSTIAAGKTRLISGGGSENKYPAGKKIRVRRVFGHGRVGKTVCPGTALNAQIKDIRHHAQALIDQSGGGVPPPS